MEYIQYYHFIGKNHGVDEEKNILITLCKV